MSKPFRVEELLKELDRVPEMRTAKDDLIRMAEAVQTADPHAYQDSFARQ